MLDKSLFKGKVVLAGVGNVLRGDDGWGSLLACELQGRVSFKVFDCGMAPENYLNVISSEKPGTIIFADTADVGTGPGEVRLLAPEKFSTPSLSLTHNSSLELLLRFLSAEGVKARVHVLCLQPETLELGSGLSRAGEEALEKVFQWFIRNFPAG